MAKSRRSRRSRSRQDRKIQVVTTPPPEDSGEESSLPPEIEKLYDKKTINFGIEYRYVYDELRNILVVAAVMFGVMAGLSYFV